MLRSNFAPRSTILVGVALCGAMLAAMASPASAAGSLKREAPAAVAASKTCNTVPDLPRRVATQSKYDQSIASRSVIDESAQQRRADTLAPITAAIRSVAALAQRQSDSQSTSSLCAIRALRHWADTAALTEMVTSDANLTRDRFTGEIAAIVLALQARGEPLEEEQAIRSWLATLARQTMAYYDWKAGPTSKRNNHRYWAGAAVADIGDFLGDKDMQAWSEASFAIGACQVDEGGFLPLELARAERALEYHLYAYGALNRLAHQAARRGKRDLPCVAGLDRLHHLLADGMASAEVFVHRTGLPQRAPSRTHLAAAMTPPPAARDLGTTSDVNPM